MLFFTSCEEQSSTPNEVDLATNEEVGQVAFNDPIVLQPEEHIYCTGSRQSSGKLGFIALRLEEHYLAPKKISDPTEKINDLSCNLHSLTINGIRDFDIARQQMQLQSVVAIQLGNIQNSDNWKIIFIHPELSDLKEKIDGAKEKLAQDCSGFPSQKDVFGFYRVGNDCNYILNKKDEASTAFEGFYEGGKNYLFVVCNEPSTIYPSGHCTLDFSYRSHKAWIIFSAKEIHAWEKHIKDINRFLDTRLVAQMSSKECFGGFCKMMLGSE